MTLEVNEHLCVYGCEIAQSDTTRFRRLWLKHWPSNETDEWIVYRINIYHLATGKWLYGVDLYGLSDYHMLLAKEFLDECIPTDCPHARTVVAFGHVD